MSDDPKGPVALITRAALAPVGAIAVTVGATTTVALAANASRKRAILVNDADETIYLALGSAAVMNAGIRLNANGGVHVEDLFTGAINAISASGSKNLCVTEV
jgi:hypothetical protein